MLSERKFGIELELTDLDIDGFSAAALEFGFRVRRDGSPSGRVWVIKHDGSVHGRGLELVSPPLAGASGLLAVRVMVTLAGQHGGAVDHSAGLHVHHDAVDLDGARLRRLLRWWVKYEPMLYDCAAPWRRGNTYCQSARPILNRMPSSDAAARDWALSADRYRSLNVAALGRHGTVEVRLPEATLDAGMVESWVVLGQRFVRRAVGGAEPGDIGVCPTQPQVMGAALRLLSRNGHTATADEEAAFNRLSAAWHKHKRTPRAAAPAQGVSVHA